MAEDMNSESVTGNILIAGDSFCGDWQYWPQFLREKFFPKELFPQRSLIIACPGGSWWDIRSVMLRDMQSNAQWYTYLQWLIYIHPSSVRPIAADQKLTQEIMVELPSKYTSDTFSEIKLCKSLYYKYVYNQNFHQWAMSKWCLELNSLFAAANVIHLFADNNDIAFASNMLQGIKTTVSLTDISMTQYASSPSAEFIAQDRQHGLYNHLTETNNVLLAQQLYRIMTLQARDLDLSQFSKYTGTIQ